MTGMIEWSQKSRPKKIPRASSNTPKKSLDQKLTPKKSHANFVALKFPERGNAITTQPGHYRFFLIPPKNPYSNQATQKNTCQIFVPKKIPESKISNPKISFDHPRQLKSWVHPLGIRSITTSMFFENLCIFSLIILLYIED